MVSLNHFFGGGEVHFVKLAALLAERYQVRALAVDAEACQRLRKLGIEVVQLPRQAAASTMGRYRYAAVELPRQIRAFRSDAIHLNGQAEIYLALIPWLYRVPIVYTRHVPFNEHIRGVRRLLVRVNLLLAERVICVSSLIRSQLSNIVPEARLTVIPNWLDSIPRPKEPIKSASESPFRLLFVGRIEVIKGIFDLIEAMRSVKDVTLDVVGSGSVEARARAAAEGLPIRFHGFQADCGSYFRSADLLVFPSHPDLEGQGQVPFEAMAHGLPCLISDIDVAMETADGGRCAEVFPCGNCGELVEAINRLQGDTDRLRELQERGLARFLATYTVDAVRGQYFDLFDRVMQHAGR